MAAKFEIKWTKEVPQSRRPSRQGVVPEIVKVLGSRPGDWAEVLRYDKGSSSAHNARRRLEKAGLEAVTRTDEQTGEVVVYARQSGK